MLLSLASSNACQALTSLPGHDNYIHSKQLPNPEWLSIKGRLVDAEPCGLSWAICVISKLMSPSWLMRFITSHWPLWAFLKVSSWFSKHLLSICCISWALLGVRYLALASPLKIAHSLEEEADRWTDKILWRKCYGWSLEHWEKNIDGVSSLDSLENGQENVSGDGAWVGYEQEWSTWKWWGRDSRLVNTSAKA